MICEKVVESCEVETFTQEAICSLIGKLLSEDQSSAAEDDPHVAAIVVLEDLSKESISTYLLQTMWKSGDVNFANVEEILGDSKNEIRSIMLTNIVATLPLPFTEETAAVLVGKLVNEDGEPADAENELVVAVQSVADSADQVIELLAEKIGSEIRLNAVYMHGHVVEPVADELPANAEEEKNE